jgi:hypothetical protein
MTIGKTTDAIHDRLLIAVNVILPTALAAGINLATNTNSLVV